MPQDVAADEEDPGAPDKHQEAKEEAAGQDLHEAANLFYTFLKTFFPLFKYSGEVPGGPALV